MRPCSDVETNPSRTGPRCLPLEAGGARSRPRPLRRLLPRPLGHAKEAWNRCALTCREIRQTGAKIIFYYYNLYCFFYLFV